MSVNIARRQLLVPNFAGELDDVIRRCGIEARYLNVEITEGTVLEVSDRLPRSLDAVKEIGAKIHIDDFGTGHSSLSCLHDFPADVLKIDQSFIRSGAMARGNAGILASIMTMAHSLDMCAVAEGIENDGALATVLSQDCDFGQGYYFSRPLDAAGARALIRSGRDWTHPARLTQTQDQTT